MDHSWWRCEIANLKLRCRGRSGREGPRGYPHGSHHEAAIRGFSRVLPNQQTDL